MTRALKVLLVDDDEDIRTIGEIALSDVGGMQTLLAGSGAAALEVTAREQPDLVLLDVMMPGLDGPSTLRKMREQPATATVPVVFVTAKIQPTEVERYAALGAIGVISKPFDPMRLSDEVRCILARNGEVVEQGA